MFEGYYGSPEKTLETWRNLWIHSGDLGFLDEDGVLHFVRRTAESINIKGEWVDVAGLEDLLRSHPKVYDCTVVGVSDPLVGKEVKACIQPREGESLEPKEILAYCEGKIAHFMIPRYVEVYRELPRLGGTGSSLHALSFYRGRVMDFQHLIYAKEPGVASITLNRPEVLNALNSRMIDELVLALQDAQEDEDVLALMLTGAGKAFCSGADLRAMASGDDRRMAIKPNAVAMRNEGRLGVQRIPRLLESMEKPCIACVNGAAVGAGFDLASMCDIRIAAESARFSINHLRVAGLSLDGGYYFLTRILGVPKTLELVWSWRMFGAQVALQMGYVNRVVADEKLMEETHAYVKQLAKGPPAAMQLAKRLVYKAWDATLDESLEDVELAWAIIRTSEDAVEGPKAWLEKREPQFTGR